LRVIAKDAVGLAVVGGGAIVPMSRGQTVHFPMTIGNRGNAAAHVDVVAKLSRATWSMHVERSHFDLDPGADQTFDVSLTAPAEAKDGEEGDVNMAIFGRLGSEFRVGGVVGARFEPTLRATGLLSIKPGGSATLNVTVVNTGNVADAFDLSVGGPVGPLPTGWTASFDRDLRTASVEPLEATYRTLTIQAPADAGGQRVQLHLFAKSVGDPSKSADHGIFVQVGPSTETPAGVPFPSWATGAALLGVAAVLARYGRGQRRG
jgi:uncharacterized membrane protein